MKNKVLRVVVAIAVTMSCMLCVVASSAAKTTSMCNNLFGNEHRIVEQFDRGAVGNHNSYSSGSSSSRSSSSRSSSSSSSRRSSSSGSSSSSSASGDGIMGSLFAVAAIIIFLVIYKKYGKQIKDTMKDLEEMKGSTTDKKIPNANWVEQIQKHDPNFQLEQFLTYAKEVFMEVNVAWTKKDWKPIRPIESDRLFNVHNKQLQEYIDNGTTNHIERIAIQDISVEGYSQKDGMEYIYVVLEARHIDYIEEDATGKILEGDKKTLWDMCYRMRFARTLDAKTSEEDGINTTNCPNCGAPTEVTQQGECEYCHTVITSGRFNWVLDDFTGDNI